ncbi:MAG: hypothetical protein J6H31_10525 [Butyrivibrio sp.]|nr:hypothetical protein [Butyrivibrio sp.]
MSRKRISTTSWNYNNVRIKSDEEIKELLCKSANAYSLICDKEVMVIYRKKHGERLNTGLTDRMITELKIRN